MGAFEIASRVLEAVPSSPSARDFISSAVSAYVSVRGGPDGDDALKRKEVVEACTDEAVELFDAALGRPDETIVEDVIAAVDKVLHAKPKTKETPADPANRKDHNKIRFGVYRDLSRRYGYNGERIPLPTLAEILVKATFPGTGVTEFTGFIPSSTSRGPHAYLAGIAVEKATKNSGQSAGSKRARCSEAADGSTASAT